MAGDINYRQKYLDLKAKFMESVDAAFRLGFEQGAQQAEVDQMQQQQMQAQQMEQQNAGMGQAPGGSNPEQEPEIDDGSMGPQQPQSENPAGSELDQHIAELEGMVNKSENPSEDLKKALDGIKSLKKSMDFQREMKKSQQAISGIAKALHKPSFKVGVQANHNMNATAKQAVSMQQEMVNGIMEKWEQEERKASDGILAQLNVEGLAKKE